MKRLKQGVTMNLGWQSESSSKAASEGKLINVVDQFIIWEGEIGERHK
jgi:hypothetical protein